MPNPAENPTILLITADELHRESLSIYGARSHITVNIDRIGNEGIFYENAYTPSPICLPARCSIATGLYPHNTRSYSNHFGASLDARLPNIFTMCRAAGYKTSLHGKGHFMPCPYAATDREVTKDFAAVKPFYLSLGVDHCDLQDDKNNSLWFYDDYSIELESLGFLKPYRDARAGRVNRHIAGFFFPGPADLHPDAWVGRKALEYIQSAETGRPHMIWASFSGPHYPIDAPREYYDRIEIEHDVPRRFSEDEFAVNDRSGYHSFNGPDGTEGCGAAKDGAQKNFTDDYWREWRRMYYANVILIDDWVGKIVSSAEEKWGDNLVVIFTTDHGDMMGNHGMWGKNGACYNDVIHVPLMIRPPGSADGGRDRRVSGLVSLIDLAPTIARYAGDGSSCEPDGQILDTIAQIGGREYVLSEAENRIVVVTKDGGKFVRATNRHGEYWEFYDLAADPWEFRNRYDDPSCHVRRARALEVYERHKDEFEPVLFYDGKHGKPPWYPGR